MMTERSAAKTATEITVALRRTNQRMLVELERSAQTLRVLSTLEHIFTNGFINVM